MSRCCSGANRVSVVAEFLSVHGATCDRCGDTREATRAAVADAGALLSPMGISIDLIERELDAESLGDSNRVLVNGLPAEEWLGGSATLSDCPSCADLIGAEACCREIEVGGVRSEAVTREVVLDAIMAAAGLAPVGAPGAACCAGPTPIAITVVTGAGCGWGGDLLCDPGSVVEFVGPEGSAWDMPGTWRAHVIAERLKEAGITATVMESDVFVLEGDERRAVLDAVVAEYADFPMVLIDGIVACHGGIDIDAVLEVAGGRGAPADAGVAAAASSATTPDAAVPVPARAEGGCCSGGCC